MKLILTQEVSGLGTAGDVVEVRDGYGRNYLLPRKFAISWTKGGEKELQAIRRARGARQVADLETARDIKARLEALTVRLKARAGDTGRLFGAVTPADIADAITDAGGPAIDKRRIEVRAAIKTVGSHTVEVRVHPEVNATFQIEVVGS